MGWSVGTVVAERYVLEAPLRRGGMGSVWRARHRTLDSVVALKQIDAELLGTDAAVRRFTREARLVAGLSSPHIVQVFDHGFDDGIPFIAMELLEGESLAERLGREGTLAPTVVLRIATHIARALTRAHDAGIVHRDLKPDNVILIANEDDEVVKVIDFGIAKVVHGDAVAGVETQTGTLIGTPHYMSPEQARAREIDLRSDLWALGVLVYECLCGQRPFEGASVSDVLVAICSDPLPIPSQRARVPSGFDEWFAQALRRDPNQRFASAREMVAALRPILSGGVVASEANAAKGREQLASMPTLVDVNRDRTDAGPPTVVDPTPAAAAASVGTNTFDGVQRRRAALPRRSRIWVVTATAGVALTAGALLWWISSSPRAVHDDVTTTKAERSPARPSNTAAPDDEATPPPTSSVAITPTVPAQPEREGPAVAKRRSPASAVSLPRAPQPSAAPPPAAPPSTAPPAATSPKDKLGF